MLRSVSSRNQVTHRNYGAQGVRPDVAFEGSGDRIQRVLRESKLSRDDFAQSIGVQGSFVSLMSSGKRGVSIDTALVIHEKYGWRPAWLVFGELPERPDSADGARQRDAFEAGRRAAFREITEFVASRGSSAPTDLADTLVAATLISQHAEDAALETADRSPRAKASGSRRTRGGR